MKTEQIKLLFLLELIPGKLNISTILKLEISNLSTLQALIKLELIAIEKNKFGDWPYLTQKGSIITKSVSYLVDTTDMLISLSDVK